jgi:prepilin-type N-terminal cleavage/methylation domain-containing protein
MRASRHRPGLTLAEVIAALAVLAVFTLAIAPLTNLRPAGQSVEMSVREACAAAFRKARNEGAPSQLRLRDGKLEAVDANANVIASASAPKDGSFILAVARPAPSPGTSNVTYEAVTSLLVRPDEGSLPFRVQLKGVGETGFDLTFDPLSGEAERPR